MDLKTETALNLAKRELENCMHNAHKGHVCFDGDDFHEALTAVTEALGTSASERQQGGETLEVRLNDSGALDEIVGAGRFHIEQMDSGHWWMLLEDQQGAAVHVHLTAKGAIKASHEAERRDHAPAATRAGEAEAQEALQAILNMDVKGHKLQDRLQFSDAGRALLLKAKSALAVQAAKALDDPRLQELFTSTIDGALTSGYQGVAPAPAGHWLEQWWKRGDAVRRHEEALAAQPPQAPPAAPSAEQGEAPNDKALRCMRGLMGAVNAYEKASGFGGWYAEEVQTWVNSLAKHLGVKVEFGCGAENPVSTQPAAPVGPVLVPVEPAEGTMMTALRQALVALEDAGSMWFKPGDVGRRLAAIDAIQSLLAAAPKTGGANG
jgi:hypothetical protein